MGLDDLKYHLKLPVKEANKGEGKVRWSLAHWFVILRLRLKKVFKKWGFHGVKRARH